MNRRLLTNQPRVGWWLPLLLATLLLVPVGMRALDFYWPEEVTTTSYADVRHFTVTNNNGEVTVTGHCSVNTELSFKLQTASGSDASATYSSSNTAVADKNTNSSSRWDELVIKGAGTTTITATLSGDYTPNTYTYTYTLVITEIDTNYGINICDYRVTSGNADNVLFNDDANAGKITYDAENGELVLNNASIPDYQELGAIQFSVENLKVRLIGENHIYNGFEYTGDEDAGTITFLSAGGEENCLVFDSAVDADAVQSNFLWKCTIANSLEEGSEWTIESKSYDARYPEYKRAYLYKHAVTSYGLTVAGVEVTSENAADITGNETNDGIPQVVFDSATNTLTLTEAQITLTEAVPLVESSLTDLTIVLQGGRSDVWWNNIPNSPEAVFVLSNNDAKLTFRTMDSSSLYINDNITLFAGIETATYEGGLMLKQNDDWSAIEPVELPYLYVNMSEDETGNPVYSLEINSDNGESTDYYYSIDYADESLEDVPMTKAEPNEDGYVSGIVLAGPCTVTAYAQVGNAKSAEKVGKLFGFETTQVKAVYGTESVALPAIIPALDESIEVYYSPGDETIATVSDGVIVLGQKIGSTSLYANLQMPDIMPDYDVLNTEGMIGEISVTILPPVLSVDLAAGTYNEPQEMTVSSNLPNTVSYEMHYQRETAGVLASDSVLYGNTLRVDATCKLYLYTRAMNDEGVSFYSDTLSLSYTIIPPTVLDISFADNTREWATYCAAERSLETPDGLQAFVVTGREGNVLTTKPISYMPQGVGILLQRSGSVSEPMKAKAYLGQEETVEENLLEGTTSTTAVSTLSGAVYVLYNGEFVHSKRGTIPAHRAYLTLSDESAGARLLIGDDDMTTGLTAVDEPQAADQGDYYNLNGQRIARPTKGLYIRNGQKTLVK